MRLGIVLFIVLIFLGCEVETPTYKNLWIVEITYTLGNKDTTSMVMPYIEGESLFQQTQRLHASPKEAWSGVSLAEELMVRPIKFDLSDPQPQMTHEWGISRDSEGKYMDPQPRLREGGGFIAQRYNPKAVDTYTILEQRTKLETKYIEQLLKRYNQ